MIDILFILMRNYKHARRGLPVNIHLRAGMTIPGILVIKLVMNFLELSVMIRK